MKNRVVMLSVAALLSLVLVWSFANLAAAYEIFETNYSLGSGQSYFIKWSPNYGTRTYQYSYAHQEWGQVRTDLSQESLTQHQNMGGYYRDQYIGISWGPLAQGATYYSDGVQAGTVGSYTPPSSVVQPPGWETWGGYNYNTIYVSKTSGSRQVDEAYSFNSTEWLSPYNGGNSYIF